MNKHEDTTSRLEIVENALSYPFRKGWPGIIIAAFIILFMLGAGVSALTDSAKPGDQTFVLDRTFEKLRIATSLSDTARFKHKVAIGEERLLELQEFKLDDINGLLGSLDELEFALIDLKSEISKVGELSGAQESANQLADNLLDLVARYRAFLLGETDETEDIQKELDDSVGDINQIISTVNQNNPSSSALPVQSSNSKPTSPAPEPITTPDPGDDSDGCNTSYQNLGNEVEREGVTLKKNDCDEYTVSFGSTTYILITNNNLDYAVGQKIKYHGESGTHNSIYLTEFELDN